MEFTIVLYTPYDVGRSITTCEIKQLYLSMGFNELIERNNVCALVKDLVETPNEISGVVYIPLDINKAWHTAVAKELRNSEYDVDMDRVL